MRKIVVATKNKGKVKEIKSILGDLPFEVLTMSEAGIDIEIEETGETFEENALIKARAMKKYTSSIVMADDSGLEVDYLNGAPGIYSARFSGNDANDEKNNKKLLELMNGVEEEKRVARFVCAISVIFEDDSHLSIRGECEGKVLTEPKGENGFGYDPLFFLTEYNASMAEVNQEVKNEISHRAKALKEFKKIIEMKESADFS